MNAIINLLFRHNLHKNGAVVMKQFAGRIIPQRSLLTCDQVRATISMLTYMYTTLISRVEHSTTRDEFALWSCSDLLKAILFLVRLTKK